MGTNIRDHHLASNDLVGQKSFTVRSHDRSVRHMGSPRRNVRLEASLGFPLLLSMSRLAQAQRVATFLRSWRTSLMKREGNG